jgi:hypothetical protein
MCLNCLKTDKAQAAALFAGEPAVDPAITFATGDRLNFLALAWLLATVEPIDGDPNDPDSIGWQALDAERIEEFKKRFKPHRARAAANLASRLSIIFEAMSGWITKRLIEEHGTPQQMADIVAAVKRAVEEAGGTIASVEVQPAEPTILAPHNGGRGPKPPVS